MKEKVAVITGASSGIGLAIAQLMAREGAIVILASPETEKLQNICSDLTRRGHRALAITTDVSIEDDCKQLIEKTLKEFGRIDILVNNAGISMRALFSDLQLHVLKKVMDINFWGMVYCTKYAIQSLIERRGTVVGISSIAGYKGLPGRTGYSASKFAMIGFLESLRIENLRSGLHVLIVAPGFTNSNIRKYALGPDGFPQNNSPRNESALMQPREVARKVVSGIKHNRRNVILTFKGRMTVMLLRIIPKLLDRFAYREMSREPDSPFR